MDLLRYNPFSREHLIVLAMKTYWQRTKMPEFFNLWCLSTVGLFALNNHYLKYQYHNWLTGKLSDFAVCFFLPLFVSSLIALLVNWPAKTRLLAGSALTIAIFSGVKISPWASNLLNEILSVVTTAVGFSPSFNRADSSDLIALPLVALACVFGINRTNADNTATRFEVKM
jgi:hypothetical protein